jgi:hypothetical protein
MCGRVVENGWRGSLEREKIDVVVWKKMAWDQVQCSDCDEVFGSRSSGTLDFDG